MHYFFAVDIERIVYRKNISTASTATPTNAKAKPIWVGVSAFRLLHDLDNKCDDDDSVVDERDDDNNEDVAVAYNCATFWPFVIFSFVIICCTICLRIAWVFCVFTFIAFGTVAAAVAVVVIVLVIVDGADFVLDFNVVVDEVKFLVSLSCGCAVFLLFLFVGVSAVDDNEVVVIDELPIYTSSFNLTLHPSSDDIWESVTTLFKLLSAILQASFDLTLSALHALLLILASFLSTSFLCS